MRGNLPVTTLLKASPFSLLQSCLSSPLVPSAVASALLPAAPSLLLRPVIFLFLHDRGSNQGHQQYQQTTDAEKSKEWFLLWRIYEHAEPLDSTTAYGAARAVSLFEAVCGNLL